MMTDITVTLPDDTADEEVGVICSRFGYDPDSGISPTDFVGQVFADMAWNYTLASRIDAAVSSARDQAIQSAQTDLSSAQANMTAKVIAVPVIKQLGEQGE
jgi:hypothetical protein